MNRTELLENAKPILFNTEMVQAILDGRKTVTRRVVKKYQHADNLSVYDNFASAYFINVGGSRSVDMDMPYRQGDILYVRETWGINYGGYNYYASLSKRLAEQYKWRPSIHMPKSAARIFLRVTGMRVERLQDITEGQAKAEGLENNVMSDFGSSALKKFVGLWDSIIKKSDIDKYGWYANPWVWVFEFERVDVK